MCEKDIGEIRVLGDFECVDRAGLVGGAPVFRYAPSEGEGADVEVVSGEDGSVERGADVGEGDWGCVCVRPGLGGRGLPSFLCGVTILRFEERRQERANAVVARVACCVPAFHGQVVVCRRLSCHRAGSSKVLSMKLATALRKCRRSRLRPRASQCLKRPAAGQRSGHRGGICDPPA